MVNVTIYSSTMDPMGYVLLLYPITFHRFGWYLQVLILKKNAEN
jgi:hypothetical protein